MMLRLEVYHLLGNTTRSKVRARVRTPGELDIVRTIGIARARFKIGTMNLGYNVCRLVQIERAAAAPPA